LPGHRAAAEFTKAVPGGIARVIFRMRWD
jgi:hypothetical protein